MLMSKLRKSSWITVVILLSIVAPAGAQISLGRLGPVLGQIIRFNEEVKTNADSLLSGLNAVGDAYLGKPIQPPNASAEDLVELTKERTKRIQALQLPSVSAPMPSSGDIPTSSFDAIRGELRTRNRMLITAVVELAQGKTLRDQLGEGVQRVEKAREAARVLSELLRRVEHLDVTQSIRFTWLELTTTVDAALSDQQSAVKEKRDEWHAKMKQRANALDAARLDLRNALLVEEAALRGQAQVSRAERDDLLARKAAVDQEQGIVDALADEIAEMRAEQAQLIDERDELRRKRNSRQSSLASLESEQRMLQNELAKPYDYCPETPKAPYDRCIHTAEKRRWDRRIADLQQKLTNVQQLIRDRRSDISDLDRQISTVNGRIAAQRSRIDQAVAKHQTREAALRQTMAKWRSDFEDFLAREHRSRVLLYADENARDQQQLAQIDGRIREVLQ